MHPPLLTSRILALTALFWLGCDKEKPATETQAPIELEGPIAAKTAGTPMEPGTSFRAKITASNVVPTPPSNRMRKHGVFRAIDVHTELKTSFIVELVSREGPVSRWRLDFEEFSSVVKNGTTEAESTNDLPGESLMVELGGEKPTVTNKAGEPATESQTRVGLSLARAFEQRDPWRTFLSSRDFEQGKITEAKSGLYLGALLQYLYGDVQEAHSTVSLFRLGLVSESEVAHFDVNSNVKVDMEGAAYGDVSQEGRMVVRLGDGMILSYDVSGKVVPRANTGEMMPTGSGTWKMAYELDLGSVRKAK